MLDSDLSGSSLGHYRILGEVGAGGMGVVYRAEDKTLGRDVAVKVLPEVFAADPERMVRFEREARLLASLNHPNIAAIYGLEEVGGKRFLVLEWVGGQTLADKLRKGPLPVEESVEVCRQIAEGLEAAHENGIIHRDLKPANVRITPDGKVKILDFGLARAFRDQAGATGLSHSPTITEEMTRPGMLLGTAAFMSPEQARGKPVDKRADIWAFGCVLFECLTGKRAFEGKTATDTMAAILKGEPDWQALPAAASDSLRAVLRRCLQKDPGLRMRDIGDARIEIGETGVHSFQEMPALRRWRASRFQSDRRRRSRIPWLAAGGAVLLAAAVLIILQITSRWLGESPPDWNSASFTQLTWDPGIESFPSLSPDGQFVVYAARGDIYLLRVGGANPMNLTVDSPSDETQPAFSPDGQWIAFRSERDGGGIYIMGATGETVKRICSFGFHPSWSPDGKEILIGSENIATPLARSTKAPARIVNVATGDMRQVGDFDAAQPAWSPNNRRIAFWTYTGLGQQPLQRDVWTMRTDGTDAVAVTNDPAVDWNPVWSTDGRFLYFVSNRSGSENIWRVRIDEESGRVLGALETVTRAGSGSRWNPTLSSDGKRIVYSDILESSCLYKASFDPITEKVTGEPVAITKGSRLDMHPAPSPDGSALAFTSYRPTEDIWVMELDGSKGYPLTNDSYLDRLPRWSPDGEQIVFYRSGPYDTWTIRADGTGQRQVTESKEYAEWPFWFPDGSRIIYSDSKSLWSVNPQKAVEDQVPVRLTDDRLLVSSWSSDGRDRLAAVMWPDPGIVVYSIPDGVLKKFTAFGMWPVWLNDNRRILFRGSSALTRDPKLYILDTQSGKYRVALEAPEGFFFSEGIAISPDNRTIYYPLGSMEADLWMLSLR